MLKLKKVILLLVVFVIVLLMVTQPTHPPVDFGVPLISLTPEQQIMILEAIED